MGGWRGICGSETRWLFCKDFEGTLIDVETSK